tara:strand:- start:13 stop:810 length:798 start_codon:yes stop_codon:yes gene_type:complete
MFIKKLQGHSGCEVVLLRRNNDELIVRKVSPSKDYDKRLNNQRIKQENFKSHFFKAPHIYQNGVINKREYFDMEFINGQTYNSFIEHADQKTAFELYKKIFDFVDKNNYINESIENQVLSKIENMNIGSEHNICKDYCLDFDWSKINKSYCHGDLTFENIIVSNSEIYFIDFLDSFVDSKIVDYSKILQDVILGWSWRQKKSKPYIKLICMYEHMIENISSSEFEASKRMLVLNMLRILPYSTNIQTTELVNQNLQFLKKEFIHE